MTSKMEETLGKENWDQERSGWKCKSGGCGHLDDCGSWGGGTLREKVKWGAWELQQHPEDCEL